MRLSRAQQWSTYGAFWWLVFFVVTHVAALFLPVDTSDGPWGHTAFIVYDLVLIGMASIGAALVLATIPGRGSRVPRWIVLVPLWIGSALLLLRGVPGMVENVLMLTGISPGGVLGMLEPSKPPPTTGEFWKSITINTLFFAGALLLTPTITGYTRRTTRTA